MTPRPSIPPACQEARDRLGAQVEGELDSTEAKALRHHLAGCDRCQAVASWIQQVDSVAASSVDTRPEPSPAFFANMTKSVMDEIGGKPRRRSERDEAHAGDVLPARAAAMLGDAGEGLDDSSDTARAGVAGPRGTAGRRGAAGRKGAAGQGSGADNSRTRGNPFGLGMGRGMGMGLGMGWWSRWRWPVVAPTAFAVLLVGVISLRQWQANPVHLPGSPGAVHLESSSADESAARPAAKSSADGFGDRDDSAPNEATKDPGLASPRSELSRDQGGKEVGKEDSKRQDGAGAFGQLVSKPTSLEKSGREEKTEGTASQATVSQATASQGTASQTPVSQGEVVLAEEVAEAAGGPSASTPVEIASKLRSVDNDDSNDGAREDRISELESRSPQAENKPAPSLDDIAQSKAIDSDNAVSALRRTLEIATEAEGQPDEIEWIRSIMNQLDGENGAQLTRESTFETDNQTRRNRSPLARRISDFAARMQNTPTLQDSVAIYLERRVNNVEDTELRVRVRRWLESRDEQ